MQWDEQSTYIYCLNGSVVMIQVKVIKSKIQFWPRTIKCTEAFPCSSCGNVISYPGHTIERAVQANESTLSAPRV